MIKNRLNPQLDLFEESIAQVIAVILDCPMQPSAAELLAYCESKLGAGTRENLKEAVITLLENSDISSHQKAFLRQMVIDRSLDRALAGKDDLSKKREVQTGIDQLVASSQAYRGSKDFQNMIEFMGKFRDYAPYNNMLVRVQNPSCSFFATERDWKNRFQRAIKEDARPMLILAPMHPVMLVYDLDSTEGAPLPQELTSFSTFEGEWNPKWLNKLIENAKRHKIRVDFKKLSSTCSGFATLAKKDSGWKMRVVIHESLDEPSRFGVLCHELAHIFLGHLGGDPDFWWPSRFNLDHSSMEIEAESVAYIITAQLDLEGSSAAYVSGHLKAGSQLPAGVSLDNIGKVSSKISHMCKTLLAQPKPRKVKGSR